MADTSQPELSEPHTNGVVDGLTEEEKSKMRPADIDADMREMERRKRVEMMMNSRLFREELERIIETQMKDGSGPSGLLQQISEMMGPQGARFNANVFKNSNCVVPINDIRGVESMGYAKGEKLLRCKLAAVFRLLDLYGWTQGVGGQITARLNQDQEHFLVNPYGLLYHEVTASSLVKVDMQGAVVEQGTTNFGVHVTGFQLHSTIHAARPDLKCIVHIATPSVTAISSMKCGLLPLGQESIVIGDVSNHQYIGGILEPEEREKITRNLGPINKVMLLTNRGAICCGETVEEAFFNVYNTVLACETQLKLMPAGLDNMNLISEESKKAIFEASRKPLIPQPSSVAEPSPLAEKLEKRWRIGGTEFEALMRMLDNAGFRTGYIYRHPLIKSEPPRIRNDVEVPPAVSSLGYLLEEEELYKQGLWKGGRKGTDRTRWLNSPNVYQKVEILETGTPDPKKITKWVDQNAEEWVTDGSPTHSSTPVRIESALQFVPKNTNPKEFKQLQQQIKDYRRADKISAGPQSHILEGVTWEEAKKMQDATISGTGEQVVLVGAASKGIIQRGFQHNAMVYKTPYAKNPFDAVTDQELDQYKKDVERKQKGDPYDESQSESEGLSSFNVSRATHESSTAKSPIQSPVSITSETEEESRDEPRVLRIATKQVPVPSQPEVVLSDVDATTEFLNEMRRTAIEPRNNINRRDCHSSTCSSENEGDTYASWPSSESYEKPHLEVARTTRIAEVMKPVLVKIPNAPLPQLKVESNVNIVKNSCDFRKPRRYDVLKRAFLNDYDKRIQARSLHPPRFVNVDTSAFPKHNVPNFDSKNFYNQPPCAVVFKSLTNEDKSLKNNNISNNTNIGSSFQDSLFNSENVIGGFKNPNLEDRKLKNVIDNQPKKISPDMQEFANQQNGSNVFTEDGVQPFKTVKSNTDNSLKNTEEKSANKKTEENRNIVNQNKIAASKPKKRCARKLDVRTQFVSRSSEDINSEECIIKDTKSQHMPGSAYVDRSTNTDVVKIDFTIPAGKSEKVESKAENKTVITVDLTMDHRPEVNFTQHINLNFEDRIESDAENHLLYPESLGEPLQAPILVQEVLRSTSGKESKEISKGVETDLKSEEEFVVIDKSQIERNDLFELQDEGGFEEFNEDVEIDHNESQSDENGNHSDENGNLSGENSYRWTLIDKNNDQFILRNKNQKLENIIDLIQYIDNNLNASRNFEASRATSDLESEEIGINKESEKEIIQEMIYDHENGKIEGEDVIFSTQESVEDNDDLNNTVICVGNQYHGQEVRSENIHKKTEVEAYLKDQNKEITGFDDKEHSNYKTDEDHISAAGETEEIEKENTLVDEEKSVLFSETENLVLSETGKEGDSELISDDIETLDTKIEEHPPKIFSEDEKAEVDVFAEPTNSNPNEEPLSTETEDHQQKEKIPATEDNEDIEQIKNKKEVEDLNARIDLNVFFSVNGIEVTAEVNNKWDEEILPCEDKASEVKISEVSAFKIYSPDETLEVDFIEQKSSKMSVSEKGTMTEFEDDTKDVEIEVISRTENKEPKIEDDVKFTELFTDENQIAESKGDSIDDRLFDEEEVLYGKHDENSDLEISLLDQAIDSEDMPERNNKDLNEKFYIDEKEIMTDVEDSKSEEVEKLEHSHETNANQEVEEIVVFPSKKKEGAKVIDVFDEPDLNLKELFSIDQIEDQEDLIAEVENKKDSITEAEEKEDSITEAEEKEYPADKAENMDNLVTEILPCNDKETALKIDEGTQEDNSDNVEDNEVLNDDITSFPEESEVKYEDFVNEMSSTEGEKNSSNAKDDEYFNLKEMFSEYEHETNKVEGANSALHEIFDTDSETIENPDEEVFPILTDVASFKAYMNKIFSMNCREIDVNEMFSVSDNQIILKADQEDVKDTMDKDSRNEEILAEDYSFKKVLKEKKGLLDPTTEDIRNNIELVSSTSSSKLERRDSITEMINSINMNITPSKMTYENLPDTDNSLKYNLDPTNMSLIYSLTPSGDITSGKGVCSKNTSIEMLGLESLDDSDQQDPFKVVKHDIFDFLDLASVKKPRDDFFYLQENDRLIKSCPNIHFVTDFLSEESFSDVENCSNQGSDILELPSSTYMELRETEEESFRYELNTTVNQILIDLEKTEIYANATNLVDDILYDISCLNICIDVKNLKEEAKLLMQERILAVFVAKDIVRGLVSNLPCFNELESSLQTERRLEPLAPVNTPTGDEVVEKTNDFESSVLVIEEIVHHIVDKLDCQKPKVYSPKRLKETMNTELKNSPDIFVEDDQDGEKKIRDENSLEGLLKNIHDDDLVPCVCPECLPKENLESIEVQKDQESLKEFLNLVNESVYEDENDFVSNQVSEDNRSFVQDQKLEVHQDLEMQNQESYVEDQSCLKTFSDPETTEEDLSNSDIEDNDVLNLKSKIVQMFGLDKKKRRKHGSNPRKFKFEKPLDLNSYEDQSPEEKHSGSNSSPSEMHSVESDNFAEQEVTSESTENDTKSDNSREKEVSNNLDPFVNENEEQEFNKLWQMRENEIEEACKARRLEDLEKSPSFIHFGEIDDVPKNTCACCIEVSIDYEDSPCKLPPIEEMNESVEFGNQMHPKSVNQTITSSSEYFTCKDESGSLLDKMENPFEESDYDDSDAHNATYTISDTSDSDKNEALEYSADISSNLDVRRPGASLPERLTDQFYDTTLNFADVSASTMYSDQELARRSARWLDINKQNYYSLACDNLESSREIETSVDVENQLFSRPDKNPADCMSYSYDTKEFIKLEKDLQEQGVICCDLKSEKNSAALCCSPPKYEDTSLYRVVTQINLADTASLSPSSFRDVSHDL